MEDVLKSADCAIIIRPRKKGEGMEVFVNRKLKMSTLDLVANLQRLVFMFQVETISNNVIFNLVDKMEHASIAAQLQGKDLKGGIIKP